MPINSQRCYLNAMNASEVAYVVGAFLADEG